MKKIFFLAGILILTGVFLLQAQDDFGWNISGELKTGLQAETFGGGKDWYGPKYDWKEATTPSGNGLGWYGWFPDEGERVPYDASMSMWSWFMGNYINLIASYNQRGYGLKTVIGIQFFRDLTITNNSEKPIAVFQPIDLWSVYAWANLFNETLKLSMGRIKHPSDAIWIAPGAWDADYNYSLGDGLRIEYKPIYGLNVGLLLSVPDIDEFWTARDKNAITGDRDSTYKLTTNPSGWMGDGKNSKLMDFFLNTGFGAKYEHEKFDAALGFKLDSKADRLIDSLWGETYFAFAIWQIFEGPVGPTKGACLMDGFYTGNSPMYGSGYLWRSRIKDAEKLMSGGMQAYLGFGLKTLKPFSIKAGARVYNMGAFERYGWIWTNQEFTYTFGMNTIALDAHQYMFMMKYNDRHTKADATDFTFGLVWKDDMHTEPEDNIPVLFIFNPRWSGFLDRNWYAGFGVPLKFWPGIINIDLTLNPKIGYTFGQLFGKTLIIEFGYLFNVITFSKYGNTFSDTKNALGNGLPPYRDSDPLIRNTFRFSFQLVF